jgi:hypothetical protein
MIVGVVESDDVPVDEIGNDTVEPLTVPGPATGYVQPLEP